MNVVSGEEKVNLGLDQEEVVCVWEEKYMEVKSWFQNENLEDGERENVFQKK